MPSLTAIEKHSNADLERPVVTLAFPDYHLFEGDELELFIWPPNQPSYEIEVCEGHQKKISNSDKNIFKYSALKEAGTCRFRARYFNIEKVAWSLWSRVLEVNFHPITDKEKVQHLREFDHRIAMMSSRDINGVSTITNPWAIPPAIQDHESVKWFRTPCYEGSTMLLNEDAAYYKDPLNYLIDNIVRLEKKGAIFRGWNDLISDNRSLSELEVIIQFDLDAGVHSMGRILSQLLPLNICCNIMIHRKCFDWYEYKIEDLDISQLKDAAKQGWTIGYHNNAISNVHFLSKTHEYNPTVLKRATEEFQSDLCYLRELFDIRVFTHHGGNVFNKRISVPQDKDVVCVDKPFNPELWRTINRSFSDGGFFSRPCTLAEKVDATETGRHFLRIHPVKYGNYTEPFDVPPLDIRDLKSMSPESSNELQERIRVEIKKQERWLDIREKYRLDKRLSYDVIHKPISKRLRPLCELEPVILKHYARRREGFRRQYPWIGGDPRVFWWRMLDAFMPTKGEILSVGAMPKNRKDETGDFVSGDIKILEMDIDPVRQPEMLCDITQADIALNEHFDGVLLFGLSCIHSPSLAVEASLRLVKPGGIAMFGFAAATHPVRGGMWNPSTRPVHRKHLEPLQEVNSGNLWSFDEVSVEFLFGEFPGVLIESFSHYWFVVCYK